MHHIDVARVVVALAALAFVCQRWDGATGAALRGQGGLWLGAGALASMRLGTLLGISERILPLMGGLCAMAASSEALYRWSSNRTSSDHRWSAARRTWLWLAGERISWAAARPTARPFVALAPQRILLPVLVAIAGALAVPVGTASEPVPGSVEAWLGTLLGERTVSREGLVAVAAGACALAGGSLGRRIAGGVGDPLLAVVLPSLAILFWHEGWTPSVDVAATVCAPLVAYTWATASVRRAVPLLVVVGLVQSVALPWFGIAAAAGVVARRIVRPVSPARFFWLSGTLLFITAVDGAAPLPPSTAMSAARAAENVAATGGPIVPRLVCVAFVASAVLLWIRSVHRAREVSARRRAGDGSLAIGTAAMCLVEFALPTALVLPPLLVLSLGTVTTMALGHRLAEGLPAASPPREFAAGAIVARAATLLLVLASLLRLDE
jgi:hypothetical protein